LGCTVDVAITRLSLFEMHYPITMNPLHNKLVYLEHDVDVANVPEDMIRVWNMQLSVNVAEITQNAFPYIQSSFLSGKENYDQNCLGKIKKFIK